MNTTTNTTNTISTLCFTFDHINKKIVGSEFNFKKSGIPGSEQDQELMARMKEHPDYTFKVVKPVKEKQTYAGLIRELMCDYLDMIGDMKMRGEIQKMKEDGVAYPTIKSYFLDSFPKFNVQKAKKLVQEYRLGNVKKKYKVIKATSSKSSSSITELPKVVNQRA